MRGGDGRGADSPGFPLPPSTKFWLTPAARPPNLGSHQPMHQQLCPCTKVELTKVLGRLNDPDVDPQSCKRDSGICCWINNLGHAKGLEIALVNILQLVESRSGHSILLSARTRVPFCNFSNAKEELIPCYLEMHPCHK